MDMNSRIDEYIQSESRRKPMTRDEMMFFYSPNAKRKENAIERFGALLSKTLATLQHRAEVKMPADAANPAPAYRRI